MPNSNSASDQPIGAAKNAGATAVSALPTVAENDPRLQARVVDALEEKHRQGKDTNTRNKKNNAWFNKKK